jgi:hypothetical protein
MPKTIIALADLYEYKLVVDMKSLIWYKEPISQFSTARLSLFGKAVNLGFGNHGLTNK